MATLVGNVNAAAALWTVSADIPDTTDYLEVDSEIVQVLAHFPGTTLRGNNEVIPPKIRVQRAAGGTTAASHSGGATLTPVIPPSAGSGGAGALTVTDGVTSVEATTLTFPADSVTDAGGGEAEVATGGVSEVKAAYVALTEAETLALADGVEIVAAVVGKILWPIHCFVLWAAGGTTPGSGGLGALQLTLDTVLPVLETADVSQVITTVDKFAILTPVSGQIVDAPPPVNVNLALMVDTASPQDLNGGVLSVVVLYHEITV